MQMAQIAAYYAALAKAYCDELVRVQDKLMDAQKKLLNLGEADLMLKYHELLGSDHPLTKRFASGCD